MPINLDSAFGIHAAAMSVRSKRAEVLASNLANADTPNYKARDIDFRSALNAALQAPAPAAPAQTHPQHLPVSSAPAGEPELLYRQPLQASLDGNTVETQREHAEFMDNALRYQASLQFLSGRIRTLLAALKGE